MRAFVAAVGRASRASATASPIPKLRQFRYGVQVNSLGLTEQQPENNAWRILIETLGVTLSRDARCRALQLPTWNEALSLPRPWDQQWSLRLQQILAYETDLLEYPDLFDGSPVIAREGRRARARRRAPRSTRSSRWAASAAAIESGYCKRRARALDGRAHGADRARRADRRRRQQVDRRRCRRRSSAATTAACSTSTRGRDRGRARVARGHARAARRGAGRGRARGARGARRARGEPIDGAVDRVRARAGDDRRVGRRAARRVGRVPRRRPASRARGLADRSRLGRACARGSRRCRAGRGCSSASRASTATPTAPRSSRSPRATPASTSSTPASGSSPPRSPRPRSRRTSTSSGSRCCRARTSSSPRR